MVKFIISILLFVCYSVDAATYYVATNGLDSADGSLATPWLTVQHAADTVAAADTVIITQGTYSEKVTETTANVTYLGTNNPRVGSFFLSNSNITLQGITLDGTGAGVSQAAVYQYSNSKDLTIRNCRFVDIAPNVYGIYGYTGTNRDNTILDGVTFSNVAGHAIVLYGNNSTITNCSFTSTFGSDAIRVISSNVRIVANTFSNWSNPFQSNGVLAIGAYYYFTATNGTPDFSNVGAGSPPYRIGESYYFQATNTTPISWGDAIVQVANHADIVQAFNNAGTLVVTNVIFERNSIINSTNCQLGNITDDKTNGMVGHWTIINNLYANTLGSFNIASPNLLFANNTLYRAKEVYFLNNLGGRCDNLMTYNNIWYECGVEPDHSNQGWYGVGAGLTNIICDYNLVIGSNTLAKQTVMWNVNGYEAHGMNGTNPSFINADLLSFMLQTNSPVIGRGINLSVYFNTDINADTRPTSWSIGAYEYQDMPSGWLNPVANFYTGLKTLTGFFTSATNSAITNVYYVANNVLIGSNSIAPYSLTYNFPVSIYTMYAVLQDTHFNINTTNISFTVISTISNLPPVRSRFR